MRKKDIFIAGITLLLLGMGYGWYWYHKPHTGVEGVKAMAHLDAVTLYGGFQKDETKADQQFVGQVLSVEGKVSQVSRTDSSMSLLLDCGNGSPGGINCSMARGESNKMPEPEKGAKITIKGRCTGFLMDVNMVDCVIEQIER